ncbi:unnamed protein product, partial [Arabidopsis halleri]
DLSYDDKNFDSVSRSDYFSTENNFYFTKVSFTQTITNRPKHSWSRYTAIVSTKTCNTVQYDIEHVKRATDSANISN